MTVQALHDPQDVAPQSAVSTELEKAIEPHTGDDDELVALEAELHAIRAGVLLPFVLRLLVADILSGGNSPTP